MTLSRLKADNVLFPRRGYSWSADMRGAAALLVSDTTFIRAETTGRAVYPLAERARALFRLQAGGMAVEDFAELPTTERFYAGGDRSVRGYKYQSLGPTDESGENTGGRYLLTGSVEADYLIWKKWGAALFIDAGNADDDFPPNLEIGAGAACAGGRRWACCASILRIRSATAMTTCASTSASDRTCNENSVPHSDHYGFLPGHDAGLCVDDPAGTETAMAELCNPCSLRV